MLTFPVQVLEMQQANDLPFGVEPAIDIKACVILMYHHENSERARSPE